MLRAIAIAAALVGMATLGPAPGLAAALSHEEDSTMKMSKRSVPEPAPVSIGGIRYQVDFGGRARGQSQTGGIIAALDEKTGEVKWTLKVYRVTFNPAKERDTQEVFITELAPGPDGHTLLVVSEAGGRYEVNLDTHRAKAIATN